MRNIIKNLGLFFGMVFLSISAMATTINPPTIEKLEKDINMKIHTGDVCTVAIAECCENLDDFYSKKDNALKVLRSGCDENCKISTAGDYTFVDFIDKEQNKVARLVINENEKILMLITHEFNNFK